MIDAPLDEELLVTFWSHGAPWGSLALQGSMVVGL
jgi:hypothetical protein